MVGVASQTFMTTANGTVQTTTDPGRARSRDGHLHGDLHGRHADRRSDRGWVADAYGPRWALGVGAAAGFVAAAVGIGYLVRFRHLRVGFAHGRPVFTLASRQDAVADEAVEEAVAPRIV